MPITQQTGMFEPGIGNGRIILLHTGMGQEMQLINTAYKNLCRKFDAKFPKIGVTSTHEIISYFLTNNYLLFFERQWFWKKTIDREKAIEYIKKRAYSFTTWAKEYVH